MLQIKNILFPTDYSACAEHAFTHAAFLADWHEARLHILNVVEAEDGEEVLLSGLPLSEEEIAEQLHMTGEDGKRDTASGDARPEIVQEQVQAASVPEVLLRYVEEHDIDLIVMGTHGRRGVRRLFLGSVAEEVVRRSSSPVLTVCKREKERKPRYAVRRLLVPVDFSDFTRPALAYAKELAQTYGARIDLLHVVEGEMLGNAYGFDLGAFSAARMKERAEEMLPELIREELGFEDVRATVEIGYPATTIADYAEEHEIDLIVIPTHGRSGLDRLVMGSVAEKVVRMAPCPVFTIKAFGKSLLPAKDAPAQRPKAIA